MTARLTPRQTMTSRRGARRQMQSLLAGTAIAMLTASGALAASTTVVPDGVAINYVPLTVDGDTLIVEQGGTVENAAGSPVEADGGGGSIGVIIRNHGEIRGTNNAGIYTLNGADIVSLVNTGSIVGDDVGIFAQNDNILGLDNTGFILGDVTGIFLSGGDLADAINSGTIAGGTSGISVGVGDILRLTNGATWEIGGADYGIEVDSGDISYLDNSGLIVGTDGAGGGLAGIRIGSGDLDNMVNQAGGLIQGGNNGIFLGGGDLFDIQNFGQILGRDGVGSGNNGIFLDGGDLANLLNGDSGAIIGDQRGIWVIGDIRNVVNSGRIAGLSQTGILVDGGEIDRVTNMQGGTIAGLVNGVQLSNNGTFSNFTNAGTIAGGHTGLYLNLGSDATGFVNEITGVITGGTDGVRTFDQGLVDSANHGTISGTDNGLFVSRNLTNFTNTGVIMVTQNSPASPVALFATDIDGLINTGTIIATNTGPGEMTAIEASDVLYSLTNSGRIFADLTGNSHAIFEDLGGDTDLTLLPGSVIQGLIDIEGGIGGNDRLFVGPGLNLATTFEQSLPEEIETYGVLMATDAATGLVAVADTSALAASDTAIADISGAVSGLLGGTLEGGVPPSERNIWIKGFGNYSRTGADGPSLGVDHAFGGVALGGDAMLGDARAGLFAGLATGALQTQIASGTRIDSTTYFAGAYGRFDAGTFYTDFALTGGVSASDAERVVANNLVLGGLETANADVTSYFIAPEVTVGTETTLGGLSVKPSATLRYNLVHSGNYSESGLTSGSLTVAGRTSHIIDARIQMAMPIEVGMPDTTIEVRAGLDGRFVAGGNELDATLAGQTITGFDPGGAQSSIGGFVAADFSHALSDASSLSAGAEIGVGTGTELAASASFGFKMSF